MSLLLIRFVILLESELLHGPAFHKWLPNGEQDSINLNTNSEEATLRVWFERFGYTEDAGMIRFNLEERSVNHDVMCRQGLLQGGPLFGELKIHLLEDETTILKQIKDEQKSDLHINFYENMGQKVVSFITEPIGKFLSILRIH